MEVEDEDIDVDDDEDVEEHNDNDTDFDELERLENLLEMYFVIIERPGAPKRERVRALHRVAHIVEQEEKKMLEAEEDPFEATSQDSIHDIFHLFMEHSNLWTVLTNTLLEETDPSILTGTCRVVLSVLSIQESHASIRDVTFSLGRITEGAVFTALIKRIEQSENSALRVLVTGIAAQTLKIRPGLHMEFINSSAFPLICERFHSLTFHTPQDKGPTVATTTNSPASSPSPSAANTIALVVDDEEDDGQVPELRSLNISKLGLYQLDRKWTTACIHALSEHPEVLGPLLQHSAVESILHLLSSKEVTSDRFFTCELLQLVSQVTIHRKFSLVFLSQNGLKILLQLPRTRYYASSLALALVGLSSEPSVMEHICLVPVPVLSRLADLGVWLMGANQTENCHRYGSVFLSAALMYKAFQEALEKTNDGIKCFIDLLTKYTNNERQDDAPAKSGQRVVHHVLLALGIYLRAYLIHKVSLMKRMDEPTRSPQQLNPAYKCINTDDATFNDSLGFLETKKAVVFWTIDFIPPLHQLLASSLPTTLLTIIDKNLQRGSSRSGGRSTAEMVVSALNILQIMTLPIPGQEHFLKTKIEQKTTIMILLDSIKHSQTEPITINSAVSVLYNFVGRPFMTNLFAKIAKMSLSATPIHPPTAPVLSTSNTTTAEASASTQPSSLVPSAPTSVTPAPQPERTGRAQLTMSGGITTPTPLVRRTSLSTPLRRPTMNQTEEGDETFRRSCKQIRSAMGVTILIELLHYKAVPHDAYIVRSNTCQLLTKLARDPTILQILNKKVSKTLPDLLRFEPGLDANSPAYKSFREDAINLIACLTGKDPSFLLANIEEPSLTKLERETRVSQTVIRYSSTEVLQLIHEHLLECGLQQTANLLLKEADIEPLPPVQPVQSNTNTTASNPSPSPVKTRYTSNTLTKTEATPPAPPSRFTLQSILSKFLYSQHLSCSHPISVLPEFPLLYKHECPRPIRSVFKKDASLNVTQRLFQRERVANGGRGGNKLTRHFVYSRYRPLKTLRDFNNELEFSCLSFVGERLLAGTTVGEIVEFSMEKHSIGSVKEGASQHGISQFHSSFDNELLLSFSSFEDDSKMWNFKEDVLHELFTFPDIISAQFPNHSKTKICGYKIPGTTVIIDTETTSVVAQFKDPLVEEVPLPKTDVVPSWSVDDLLVMSDGLLWDYRYGRQIHRFDKFSNHGSETFNRNGYEVIINSEIWDLRTFKLIKTVTPLDQLKLTFNSAGDVIFGFVKKHTSKFSPVYAKSFYAIDGIDYDVITNMTLENRYLSGLAVNKTDTMLALLETHISDSITFESDSVVRLWSIGSSRQADDDIDGEEPEVDSDSWLSGDLPGDSDDDFFDEDDDDDEDFDGDDDEDEDDDDDDEPIVYAPPLSSDDAEEDKDSDDKDKEEKEEDDEDKDSDDKDEKEPDDY